MGTYELFKHFYTNYGVKEAGAGAAILRDAIRRGKQIGGKRLSPEIIRNLSLAEKKELLRGARIKAGFRPNITESQIREAIRNARPTTAIPNMGAEAVAPEAAAATQGFFRRHPWSTVGGVAGLSAAGSGGLYFWNKHLDSVTAAMEAEHKANAALNSARRQAAVAAPSASVSSSAAPVTPPPEAISGAANASKPVEFAKKLRAAGGKNIFNRPISRNKIPQPQNDPQNVDMPYGLAGATMDNIRGQDRFGNYRRIAAGNELSHYRRMLRNAGFANYGQGWNIWDGTNWRKLPKGMTPSHVRSALSRGVVYDNVFEPSNNDGYGFI